MTDHRRYGARRETPGAPIIIYILQNQVFSVKVSLSIYVGFKNKYARVAQLVEHSTDTRKVLGSTPSARTLIIFIILCSHEKLKF